MAVKGRFSFLNILSHWCLWTCGVNDALNAVLVNLGDSWHGAIDGDLY